MYLFLDFSQEVLILLSLFCNVCANLAANLLNVCLVFVECGRFTPLKKYMTSVSKLIRQISSPMAINVQGISCTREQLHFPY